MWSRLPGLVSMLAYMTANRRPIAWSSWLMMPKYLSAILSASQCVMMPFSLRRNWIAQIGWHLIFYLLAISLNDIRRRLLSPEGVVFISRRNAKFLWPVPFSMSASAFACWPSWHDASRQWHFTCDFIRNGHASCVRRWNASDQALRRRFIQPIYIAARNTSMISNNRRSSSPGLRYLAQFRSQYRRQIIEPRPNSTSSAIIIHYVLCIYY